MELQARPPEDVLRAVDTLRSQLASRRSCLIAGLGFGASIALPAHSAAAGQVAEWPVVRLLDGTILEPDSWREQASVVVFWATYCPYCKRHNAHVDKLARAMVGQRLRILGIALDTDEQVVRRYMAANDYRFPVTMDGTSLRAQLGLRSVTPMTCVFDRRGRLVQAIPGEMFEADVLGFVKLASKAAA